MVFSEVKIADIKQTKIIRNTATGNILSNPNLITDQNFELFISMSVQGWVLEID
jgi:hypothetical protein